MKAWIGWLGDLHLEAETPTEGYALSQWYSEACGKDDKPEKVTIEVNPVHNVTMGPQPVRLLSIEFKEGEEAKTSFEQGGGPR